MSKFVPFTAHIKIHPARPGKRFEYIRELQRYATLIYDAIDGIANVNIAQPGGGQDRSNNFMSGLTSGCAIKPQFGNTPPQLQITGFYNVSSNNDQTYSDKQVIHAGEDLTGAAGAHSYETIPTTTVNDEVKTLKALLETNIDATVPDTITYSIFRIDYSGIVYGDRGFHFPQ